MNNVNSNRDLNGQRVILLGASSGIGLATAKAAAAEQAQVVIVSGNEQRIQAALQQLPEGSEGYAVDLSREENIRSFFGTIGAFDHLVYTAGENLVLNTMNQTEINDARRFMDIRFWGAFTAVKYGAPLIRQGGSINLIGGTASARPGKGWGVAAAICGAMEGLVRALAVELAPVRVNSIMPGIVDTQLWKGLPEADKEALFATYNRTLPTGRVGLAEDIALGYLYLMKQQYGTGRNLVIDGGGVLI
ncbi:SDR family oxidoreductase [Chitinophaga sp. 212800010-3]|uniref:SDR family oxidoreductase n=1 Tax=unclassified Chitinophaga TaxID=2619133 RepID=UPI002DEC0136|nr:3-alpha-hydroxycholanate dehydrogenase (NADP(+)) [Chitinophaga sp. 212800010-3]